LPEPEPVIRRATTADVSGAAEVYLRARHAAVPTIPALAHDDDDVRGWFRDVVVAERELWVAEGGSGAVVGILVLDGDHLDQLYVEPGLTGRGIGSTLLSEAKRVRPRGLQLWAFQSNGGALRFYERHGFVEAERTDGHANEEGAPDVRFVWAPPGRRL
jgi:ribosomal protein S18 acetylase RimI-like enzyme